MWRHCDDVWQGDEEKLKGMTPMPMMDRDKQNELPQLEVSDSPYPHSFVTGSHVRVLALVTQLFGYTT